VSDKDHIKTLLEQGTNAALLQISQMKAAQLLLAYDGEKYPQDGCAITLSVLMQAAGIDVPNTYTAIEVGRRLRDKRGWEVIAPGNQQPGDVGSTCGEQPNHGVDHIYLLVKNVSPDEMLVADNQRSYAHTRSVSGVPDGKSKTQFFLRAV
jgi:hypothetical protein